MDQDPIDDVTQHTATTDGDRPPELEAPQDVEVLATLQHRVNRSQTAQDLALQELRAVMPDSDAHRNYGIDLTQI